MDIKVASLRGGLSSDLGWVDVRVDRASVLGNPFELRDESERDAVIVAYRKWLWACIKLSDKSLGCGVVEPGAIAPDLKIGSKWKRPDAVEVVNELNRILVLARNSKVRLICWCAPLPCHADVVKKCVEWMGA